MVSEEERERKREHFRFREECNESKALQVMKPYEQRMTPRTKCPGIDVQDINTQHTSETATHGNSDINIWVIPVMQYLLNFKLIRYDVLL